MSERPERFSKAVADRYAVERELGRGGMATVYLARDRKHHRPVAIKMLQPELARAVGKDRFLREIEVSARLAHPHILPLLDSGDAAGTLFYVMPYVEGESLRQRLDRERQLPVDEALRLTGEVADALGYAHALGILHRDVKPENILLQAGHAVVADFGIARAIDQAGGDRLTETGLAIGTPAYMSPEQAGGETTLDGRSDLYSLACVLFEMLAGEPPFAAATVQALLARKATESPPSVASLRATVSPHVAAALAKALAAVPSDRFATVGEFVAALRGTEMAAAEERAAVAVLPFANMSAEPENEYFSDGITEEVINAVAQVPDLRVTARTSAFQFKGKEYDVREIGRKLSVRAVLEGSVRKVGNRVRITAQLVDATNGYHLWSERFDRDLEDVFAIQDEIAAAIAGRLRRELAVPAATAPAGGATRGTRADPAAFDAYLRGRYHRQRMFAGGNAIERAEAGYGEAIRIDPTFAPAYSALAELRIVLAMGFAPQPSRELLPQAKDAAERALALDPSLAEAHLAQALVAMFGEWDYAAARAGIERAIALNANSVDAYFWSEWYYTYVERAYDRAVAANRRAAELDPLDLNVASRLSQVMLIFDRVDEAIERLHRILETDPDHMVSYLELADAYARKGDRAKAVAAAERAVALSGGAAVAVLGMLATICAWAGQATRAREVLVLLGERAGSEYVSPFWLAIAHAALGESDRAFAFLDDALRDRDPNLLYITAVPREIGLQRDPRYGAILRTIGLGHLVEEHPR
jgi:serine/threonine protein kinase/Tfp pilus assembly protein PilF